ncbi:thiamine phosphate synthase [Candidatus Poribacteria bacterium]|nr:thiamine phosphate synthase [Candidatus Poribacteria bacterium]
MKPAFPSGLVYAITHAGLSCLPHAEQVRRLLAAGARLIQLRAKELTPEQLELEARRCAGLCHTAGAILIVNDDPRAAVLSGADGAHIGQGDMEPERARELIGPDRLLGFSTHNEEQVRDALRRPIDYVAVGPVFGTTTKDHPDPATGLELVRFAVRQAAGRIPVVAIGGITKDNLPALLHAAPSVVPAVIGAIMKAPDIGRAFAEMADTLAAARSR